MIAGPLGLVALIAAAITAGGGDDGSPLRHLYQLPVLWAALARGAAGGAVVGLLATGPVHVRGMESVSDSFPGFLAALEAVR